MHLFPVRADAWQLLYRTTGANGEPYASVTIVLVPNGPTRPRSLLSTQMAYDGMQRACMPSYSLVNADPVDILAPDPNPSTSAPAVELAFAETGLEKGWAVSIPDAGGIDDRFLTPNMMGYTTLDGIRAAQNFAPLGLGGPSTPTAMWGYSGGAATTQWAADLQPAYAPELNIVGAALGAPVPDLSAALLSSGGRVTSGLLPLGLAALAKDEPNLFDRYLSPAGKEAVAGECDHCCDVRTVEQRGSSLTGGRAARHPRTVAAPPVTWPGGAPTDGCLRSRAYRGRRPLATRPLVCSGDLSGHGRRVVRASHNSRVPRPAHSGVMSNLQPAPEDLVRALAHGR